MFSTGFVTAIRRQVEWFMAPGLAEKRIWLILVFFLPGCVRAGYSSSTDAFQPATDTRPAVDARPLLDMISAQESIPPVDAAPDTFGPPKPLITMQIDSSKIDQNLVDFPLLVRLSASSGSTGADLTKIFTVLGSDANRKRIKVLTGTGTTCYVELARWDTSKQIAYLWVRVPMISSTKDTILTLDASPLMLKDTTHVGDTAEAPAQKVWANGYRAAWHLLQPPSGSAPQMLDSTSNKFHGTVEGSMDQTDMVPGLKTHALEFDGINDAIVIPTLWSTVPSALTFKVLVRASNTAAHQFFLYHGNQGEVVLNTNAKTFGFGAKLTNSAWYSANAAVQDGTWYHAVGTWKPGELKLYLNGALAKTTLTPALSPLGAVANPARIGSRTDVNKSSYFFEGAIEHVHISLVARTAAWIKASYHSEADQLITYK
jgi:hypothetical protein